ncbi:hypothetical protein ACET3Z_011012 [Daucus carota]
MTLKEADAAEDEANENSHVAVRKAQGKAASHSRAIEEAHNKYPKTAEDEADENSHVAVRKAQGKAASHSQAIEDAHKKYPKTAETKICSHQTPEEAAKDAF